MHFIARQLQFYSPEEAAEKLLDGKNFCLALETFRLLPRYLSVIYLLDLRIAFLPKILGIFSARGN